MAHNSKWRKTAYKPRMTDYEAYEQLHPKVKKVLQESLNDWSSYWCLRQCKKRGIDYVINAIRNGDKRIMEKGFIVKRGRGVNMPSSYTVCKVEPLRANW